ncbi:HET-domain-containing protein [Hypoxylon sp. FL1857]|nr:HET-domain-containing protein [Hypoxylon sp. FL1857]
MTPNTQLSRGWNTIECFYCEQRKDSINPWVRQSLTIGQLKSGVELLGCRTCDLRLRAVRCFHSDPDKVVMFFDSGRLSFDRRQFFEIFKLASAELDGYENIQTGHLLSKATSSEDTLSRAQGWIDECKSNHPACQNASGSSPYMPKRVLNLSNNRVVLQIDVKPSPYACLSHCWGPSHSPIKTLLSTITDFQSEIPWKQLSKTFQDAVDICRRLRVDYLWIDSLCIIQDSAEDWNEESVKMADIYENAFFTIAATKSKDGSGGCYSDRDPGYFNSSAVVEGSIYIRRQIPSFPERGFHSARWPLLARGWVFQEMSLSKRVLHFGHQEVIWQCRSCRKSESGNNDLDPGPITEGDLTRGHSQAENKESSEPLWDGSWYDIVNEYSGLALSFEKDKLPALAAISQRTAQKRSADDRFLAGLWQKTLLLDLLWETYQRGSNGPVEKPTKCSAPSWSWASVKSHVKWFVLKNFRFPRHPLRCLDLVTVNVETIGSPYLGQCSRSELIFRGPLLDTTAGDLEPSVFMQLSDKHQGFQIDGVMAVHQFVPDYEFAADGPIYGPPSSRLAILPLMMHHGGFNLVDALVLRPRDGEDTYERVGLALLVYVKRGPPWDSKKAEDGVYRPSDLITREWIDSYLSSLLTLEVVIT